MKKPYALVVKDRAFMIAPEIAKPLIDADVLYWDTQGDSWPKERHLHLNPEMHTFPRLEKKVYRLGVAALLGVRS